jgi:hypothetical protein
MELLEPLVQTIVHGGNGAVTALLIAVVILLLLDRKSLLDVLKSHNTEVNETHQKVVNAKEQEVNSIKEIVEKYHNGTLSTIQALNEIKIVLVSIKESIK